MNTTPWIKASRSANNNDCVELRRSGDVVQVRDSKDTAGPVLSFSRSGLAAWLDGAKRGDFDDLR